MTPTQLPIALLKRLAPCASKEPRGWTSIVVIPHAAGIDALAVNGRAAACLRLDSRPAEPSHPSAISADGAKGLRAGDSASWDAGAVTIRHASGASWTLPPAPRSGDESGRPLPPIPDVLPPASRYVAGVFVSPKLLAEALAAVSEQNSDRPVFLALPDAAPTQPIVLLGESGAAVVGQVSETSQAAREERWFVANVDEARKRFLDAHAAAKRYSCAVG